LFHITRPLIDPVGAALSGTNHVKVENLASNLLVLGKRRIPAKPEPD
jgi:hypothetical protein